MYCNVMSMGFILLFDIHIPLLYSYLYYYFILSNELGAGEIPCMALIKCTQTFLFYLQFLNLLTFVLVTIFLFLFYVC